MLPRYGKSERDEEEFEAIASQQRFKLGGDEAVRALVRDVAHFWLRTSNTGGRTRAT